MASSATLIIIKKLLCFNIIYTVYNFICISTEAHRLVSCIEQLNSWMTSNRLKLNADKTQFLWCGSAQQRKNISVKELHGTYGSSTGSIRQCNVPWNSH